MFCRFPRVKHFFLVIFGLLQQLVSLRRQQSFKSIVGLGQLALQSHEVLVHSDLLRVQVSAGGFPDAQFGGGVGGVRAEDVAERASDLVKVGYPVSMMRSNPARRTAGFFTVVTVDVHLTVRMSITAATIERNQRM